MLIKMVLATALVVGAGSAALAGDNSGEYSGGFVMPGNMNGVNPVYHPELFAGRAYDLAPSITTPHTWRAAKQKHPAGK